MIRLVLKVGDQTLNDYGGMKDGMLVTTLHPLMLLSEHMRTVYAVLDVPESWASAITVGLCPHETQDIDPDTGEYIPPTASSRQRCGYVDLNELAAALGDTSLVDKWRSGNPVSAQDGALLAPTMVKDSTGHVFPPILDNNLVTTGGFTVGAGGSYSNWGAAFADVGTPLTGGLNFNQISDTLETAAMAMIVSLSGQLLTLQSNAFHNGFPLAGFKTDLAFDSGSTAAMRVFLAGPGGNGFLIIRFLNIFASILSPGNGDCIQIATAQNTTTRINDVLVDCNGNRDGIEAPANGNVEFWNNVVWEASNACYNSFATIGDVKWENCIAFAGNIGFIWPNIATSFVRNLVAIANTTIDFTVFSTLTKREHLASQDLTATGVSPLTSVLPMNEFLTLDDTSPQFLRLKAGTLDTSGIGTSLFLNTRGIRQNFRPGTDGFVSRGADEFEVFVPPPPGGAARSGLLIQA